MEFTVNHMKPGDVILVNDQSFSNILVRYFTQSHWGHSVLYAGKGMYLESNPAGVMYKSLKQLQKSNRLAVYRHIDVTGHYGRKIVTSASRHEAKGYDWLAIWDLFKMFITKKKQGAGYAGVRNKFTCSELCAVGFYENGLSVQNGVPYDNIMPADFDLSQHFIRIGYLEL